uniref:Uncharacterized protein n=1 Tax=Cacopsylla melanoneura TaxID=428564 RepID=A0A8D9AX70_9HEMI
MLWSSVYWTFVWHITVSCYPTSDLFKSYLKSRNLESLYNIVVTTTSPAQSTTTYPTSYAIVEEKSAETVFPPLKSDDKEGIVTESPIQECFNELAANNFPRILKAMDNMTEEQIKVHPIFKAFYYTATRVGQDWRSFFNILRDLSPTQMREALKLINTFENVAKPGGMDANDRAFLRDYQQNLFSDFQKLNDIKLSEKEKTEIAEQYKGQDPAFGKQNDELQRRLDNVMQKFSSDEIRNDPGLKNMRHVGIDPEQFVTLKRMVQDKMESVRQWNQTIMEEMAWNQQVPDFTQPVITGPDKSCVW